MRHAMIPNTTCVAKSFAIYVSIDNVYVTLAPKRACCRFATDAPQLYAV